MKTKIRLSYCALVAVILFSSSIAQSQTRVYFAHGATRTTARGYLRGIRDEANFVLRAKSGQHMRVEIRGRGATRGVVIFPSSGQDGGPGGVVFDGVLPDTGDYRVRVTESSMADAWRGNFTLIVDIVSQDATSAPTNQDLSRYVGKYPSELFRKESSLKTRLRKLLGTNYQFFFNRLQTEMPIENDGGILIIQGCMAHQCTIEVSVMAIDLANDKLHVAIKSVEFRSMYKIWNEGEAAVPAALRRAMQRASPP